MKRHYFNTMKTHCFDLNFTLFSNKNDDYEITFAFQNNVGALDRLYRKCHYFFVQTATGLQTVVDHRKKSTKNRVFWDMKCLKLFFCNVIAENHTYFNAKSERKLEECCHVPSRYLNLKIKKFRLME